MTVWTVQAQLLFGKRLIHDKYQQLSYEGRAYCFYVCFHQLDLSIINTNFICLQQMSNVCYIVS